MFRLIKRAPWIALGAAGAWFFDPHCGAERRAEAKRKADELFGTPGTAAPTTLHDEAADPLHESRPASRAQTA